VVKMRRAFATAAAAVILIAGMFFLLARRTPAQTKQLRVYTSDGIKAAYLELVPQMEQATGRKLVTQFNSSKNIRDKIQAGEPFDVAILTSEMIDDLIKQGKIPAGSRIDLARTGIGVGVRGGAPGPDISTPEAMKQALLNAKAISFNPSGASAVHIYDMFARMGITEAVKPKLVLNSEAGGPQKDVVEGKSELVMTLVPEIKYFPGMELVGPLPADFQSYVNFSAGVATASQDPAAAQALLHFLSGPALAPVLKAKGMEPR
jgi:molybdate transport system substrate-binding protein